MGISKERNGMLTVINESGNEEEEEEERTQAGEPFFVFTRMDVMLMSQCGQCSVNDAERCDKIQLTRKAYTTF